MKRREFITLLAAGRSHGLSRRARSSSDCLRSGPFTVLPRRGTKIS
jgi:hypothetical protein